MFYPHIKIVYHAGVYAVFDGLKQHFRCTFRTGDPFITNDEPDVFSITGVIVKWVRTRVSLVASTVGTGLFLNCTTGDQFISIVLTADIFRDVYKEEGYEARLLSRTTEDAATVTSVLVPWNTCGMTQATVLGVPTLTYLPYCFFNLLSPLTTIIVAAIGWRIKRHKPAPPSSTAEVDELD